jgi:hypothetical protein
MKYRTILLIVASFSWMAPSGLQAQEAILSSSNNAAGIDGSVSYSVGQVAFITIGGGGGNVMEGVQQPYEILFMDGIDDAPGISLKCMVYPNPADAYVRLKIEDDAILNPGCHLFNINGVLLQDIKLESREVTIPMDDLSPATYFLAVYSNGKALQTYKIIKK